MLGYTTYCWMVKSESILLHFAWDIKDGTTQLASRIQGCTPLNFFLWDNWRIYPYYIFNLLCLGFCFFFFFMSWVAIERVFWEFYHYNSFTSFWLIDCWMLVRFMYVEFTLIVEFFCLFTIFYECVSLNT